MGGRELEPLKLGPIMTLLEEEELQLLAGGHQRLWTPSWRRPETVDTVLEGTGWTSTPPARRHLCPACYVLFDTKLIGCLRRQGMFP